jgi:molybdopterin converting factor small subunit
LNITLKYFSWIRVKLKKSHDLIEFNQTISFKELKSNLISKDPIFQEIFNDESVKYFLNLNELKDENQILNNGDVLAFLPPVTGG